MNLRVEPDKVWRGKSVELIRDIPADGKFNNTRDLSAGETGVVLSEGFLGGMLRVEFYSHYLGRQEVTFNPLSAQNFLTTDWAVQQR